jgi:hypothetical protein
MSKISRNAPCACGSGRKYKQCCLRREDEWQDHRAHLRAGAGAVVAWLHRSHTEAVEAAVADEFLGCLNEEDHEAIAAFDPVRLEMIHLNADDWLLAEARLRVPGERRRSASQLVMDAGGPLLTVDQRDHVQAIAASPLRLYEVTAVERGTGIEVRDLLAVSSPPVRVRDTSLSQSLERWETIALRLVQCREVAIPTCVYHYPPTHGTWLLDQIRHRL